MCVVVRVPPELQQIHYDHHPAAELLNHVREHYFTIYLPWGITEADLRTALHYELHSSAVN